MLEKLVYIEVNGFQLISECCRVVGKNNISEEVVPSSDNSIEKNRFMCVGFCNRNCKFERMAAKVIVGIESEGWVIDESVLS